MAEPSTAQDVWERMAAVLRRSVPKQQFETWFRGMRLVSLEPERVELSVPNNFLREWILKRYANVLRTAIREITGSDPAVDRLRLSVDEWGIVREWDPKPDGPGVGIYEVYYTLGDGIANARALHELIRAADLVEIAQWAQTVNIIGAIKTSRTHASMGPVGHFLALYRARVGGDVAPTSLSSNAPLDVVAARDEEKKILSLGLINYSPREDVAVNLDVRGGGDFQTIRGWRITGPGLDAINVPGRPEEVVTTELPHGLALDQPVVLPRHSITVVEMIEARP